MKDTSAHVVDVKGSLLFPGPRNASPEHASLLEALARLCEGKVRADFMIDLDGVFFRARRDEYAIDGIWYRLRRIPEEPPCLDTLKFRLPQGVEARLLDPSLSAGGLITIVGPTGAGKTHSAAATVVSRLRKFGGIAYTVEEPVELPLNGRHGDGYCTQTEVAGKKDSDWTESLRGVLRSQPVGTRVILYVGEIRDADAAKMILRAATNGFLVICTGFGANVIAGLTELLNLVGPENVNTVAQVIRLSVYQQLRPDRLLVECLASDGPNSRVSAIIRHGSLTQLADEIQVQRNAMAREAHAAARAAPVETA